METPQNSDVPAKPKPDKQLRDHPPHSMGAAIAREGGSFFKGESLVPQTTRATAQILLFLRDHLRDPSNALRATVETHIKASPAKVARHLENPLDALKLFLETVLESETSLAGFVRQVDAEWGRRFGERPHFQRGGQAPHPQDEYTHESVREDLLSLLRALSKDR